MFYHYLISGIVEPGYQNISVSLQLRKLKLCLVIFTVDALAPQVIENSLQPPTYVPLLNKYKILEQQMTILGSRQ